MLNIFSKHGNFVSRLPSAQELAALFTAIDKAQAIIEFNLDGTIITANKNFLDAMGYSLSEIAGKHHRIFVDEAYARSSEYRKFWEKLGCGESDSGEYKRLGKGGREVWIQASYNPVFNKAGRPVKIVKFATDITAQKLRNADFVGQIEAISKSQAVIHFNMDGTIITANQNFLEAVGYSLGDIVGKHHSMFASAGYAGSREYEAFWEKLRRGEFDSGEYKRLGKGGREIWIQASYNPILDMDGKPFKVVKYATDITAQKIATADARGQLDAISRAQAVIEFNLDGTIITANKNFLGAVGYSLGEVQGKHHSMFVEPAYAQSAEYKDFWARLRSGAFESRVYKRLAKGGREIWIQASYNPIFDMDGKPFKVVKYATDVTRLMQTMELTDKTSSKMQSVAAAIEELSASVSEIGTNMARSRQATDDIRGRIAASNEASSCLSETMGSMQGIVEFISDIAAQVNLLALNATIEAARAGDAGKGFAVVASEVKNLAGQTAKATEDIVEKISSVQDLSRRVVRSVNDISEAAASVSQYVGNAAAAVDQQAAVTREVSANTQDVSSAVTEVSRRIRQLSEG